MSEALENAIGACQPLLSYLKAAASPAYFDELSALVNSGATEDDELTDPERLIEFLERTSESGHST